MTDHITSMTHTADVCENHSVMWNTKGGFGIIVLVIHIIHTITITTFLFKCGDLSGSLRGIFLAVLKDYVSIADQPRFSSFFFRCLESNIK